MIRQIVRHLRQQTLTIHLQTLQQHRAAHFLFRAVGIIIPRPHRQREFKRRGVFLGEIDDFLKTVDGGFPDLGPVRVRGREVEEVGVAGDGAVAAERGIVAAFRARVGDFAFVVGVIVVDPEGP